MRTDRYPWRLRVATAVVAIAAGVILLQIEDETGPPPWRGGTTWWPRSSPHESGFDAEAMDNLRRRLARTETDAFLVVRRGRLVQEFYRFGNFPWRRQGAASLSKSLVGATAALIAASDGRIAWDRPVSSYVQTWTPDSVRAAITFRHLLAHSSGLPHGSPTRGRRWATRFWKRDPRLFHSIVADAELLFPPGSAYHYSGPGYAVFSYALTASLHGSPHEDIDALLRERILRPLGIPFSEWSTGYGTPFRVDGMQIYATWSGAKVTPRAAVRLGELILRHGRWRGRVLIDSSLVSDAVRRAGPSPKKGSEEGERLVPTLGWWSNADGRWPRVPRDAFVGVGAGGQVLLIVPSLDLVVARFGRNFGPGTGYRTLWDDIDRHLFEPLMDALSTSVPIRREAERRSGVLRTAQDCPDAAHTART